MPRDMISVHSANDHQIMGRILDHDATSCLALPARNPVYQVRLARFIGFRTVKHLHRH